MDITIIRRLTLARHLVELAAASLRTSNDLHLFSAVNLLQDAVEAFLIAVAEHVGASLDPHTPFDKYFVAIDAKIAPATLPFKTRLLQLNKLRVNSKHHGLQPSREECQRLALTVKEFLASVSATHFGASFSTVSALDLLAEGAVKERLIEARDALADGNNVECAIACRKALFLQIERDYDVEPFENNDILSMMGMGSRAPSYAKNREYIAKHVESATDFIVYDHSSINEKLLTHGVDHTSFWNVWRLTPEVYQSRGKDGRWFVKYEFNKLDESHLADKIEYIFSTTLDIVLAVARTEDARRWRADGRYVLELKEESVPVYRKADATSEVVAVTAPGVRELDTEFRIEGRDGTVYWYVVSYRELPIFRGYVHSDVVK